jgi:hypothetical protein
MKLTTDMKPRKDGTVTATVPATDAVPSSRYVFKQDADGRLLCDVEHEAHIGWLLDSGFFYPADESDIEAGIDAVNQQHDDGEGSGEDESDIEAGAEEQPKSKKKSK